MGIIIVHGNKFDSYGRDTGKVEITFNKIKDTVFLHIDTGKRNTNISMTAREFQRVVGWAIDNQCNEIPKHFDVDWS